MKNNPMVTEKLARVNEQIDAVLRGESSQHVKKQRMNEPIKEWLFKQAFADKLFRGLTYWHEDIYDYMDTFRRNEPVDESLIVIAPRGEGKSTTIQLGVTACCAKEPPSRKCILYVNETQDGANQKLAEIAQWCMQCGIQASLREDKNVKEKWSATQITMPGVVILSAGMDKSIRGLKVGGERPDLIILDDIDNADDTPEKVKKKINRLKKTILPAASVGAPVIFVQNLVHAHSCMSVLIDPSQADFLLNRRIIGPVKMVENAKVELRKDQVGKSFYVLTGGQTTWPPSKYGPGMDLKAIEAEINKYGLDAWLTECQHDVISGKSQFFKIEKLANLVEKKDIYGEYKRIVRAWDFASTQRGGDYTCTVLLGETHNQMYDILDVIRMQLSPENVEMLMSLCMEWDNQYWVPNHVQSKKRFKTVFPTEIGAAGKQMQAYLKKNFYAANPQFEEVANAVKKATRAIPASRLINSGNVRIVKDGPRGYALLDEFLGEMARQNLIEGTQDSWNRDFLIELDKFTTNDTHDYDDQVDALASAVNSLVAVTKFEAGMSNYREYLRRLKGEDAA